MKNSRFLGKAAAKAALNIFECFLIYMIFTVRFSLKLSTHTPSRGGTRAFCRQSAGRSSGVRCRHLGRKPGRRRSLPGAVSATLEALRRQAGDFGVESATGTQALRLAQDQEVDVVFTDRTGSPGMDGFRFLKAFKLAQPGVPVILFSGTLTLARARRAYRLGAFLCLPKGGTSSDLLAAVRKALAQRTARR
jgi:CheY-like chemotaxis protein